jgi:uncharacterized membrane protein (DUF485 family)
MKQVSRLGIFLFLLYCVLYFGFVLANTFQPQWMELRPFLGLNLSITYGFGLILAAFILALIYGAIQTDDPSLDASHQPPAKEERR